MTAIGDTLRRERMRRRLDLETVSRELKIPPKMLSAIEEERFDRLPGGVFAKSFVRQYAHLLGLDEEEMAGEVQRMLQPAPEAPPVSGGNRPLAAPIQVPRVRQWNAIGDGPVRWKAPLISLALVVVVMMGCAGVYSWWQRTRAHRPAQQAQVNAAPAAARPQPPVNPVAASAPATPAGEQPASPASDTPSATPSTTRTETASPHAAPPAEEAKAPAPAPAGTPAATDPMAPPPNPNAPVRVELKASEPVWVSVRSDGKYLFSGTLEANQTRTVDANEKVVLRLGNAGGIDVTLNGKPLGTLGPKGQIRTVQLTSGGFEIVAAPKAPPSDPLGPLR